MTEGEAGRGVAFVVCDLSQKAGRIGHPAPDLGEGKAVLDTLRLSYETARKRLAAIAHAEPKAAERLLDTP
jgi:hypothetical protein